MMETAVAENIDGVCANALKSKIDQSSDNDRGEAKASNDLPNAWKINRDSTGLTSASANNIQSAKTLHSTNGTCGGNGISSQGHYGSSSFHDKDSRAKPRHKYNKPAPKIVAPIVTDKEDDWPTLGTAATSKSVTGLGLRSNGTGLLNGFTTKNHKRSTSTTGSPSTSSRTNSIIGQDDAERASIVSGEGGDNPNLDVDQIDGEVSTKLRVECTFKSEDTELPKETNNNETRKSEEEILSAKKDTTRSARGKLKWKPLPLPAISPSRPLRPRRWEEKDSSARNGVGNGPTRTSHSTITTFANSQNDSSQHGTNATPTVQRGRGHHRTAMSRGGHHDYQGHDENDDGHFVDYYDDKRRSNNNYGRAYYGGRPRGGGGGGRWQHSRGGGASRNSRHEEDDDGSAASAPAPAHGRQSRNSNGGYESQENYHAGNGGGNSKSYAGAISNTNNRAGNGSGDYNYTGKNSPYPDYPPPYSEVVAVGYPYDSAAAFVATQSLLTTAGVTITTTTVQQRLPSCSPSPIVTTTVHQQFTLPFSPRLTQSPVTPIISTPTGDLIPVGLPTTMEQVVDDPRLRDMVTKQIMYYLSEENLEQDFYLRRQMNAEGFIDIVILAGFHRLKGMTSNLELILEVILSCPDKFEVNEEMTHVRPRVNPTMWPVLNETEPEQGPDPTSTESSVTEPVVSYNTEEYTSVGYYSVSPAITTVVGENHGYQVQSISSASSTSSLACTSSSLSPGLLRPFKLNPDVPEFVPRGVHPASPDKKNEPTDKPE